MTCFTDEAIEKGAKALAEALHGGSWSKDYTETQKTVWRNRVAAAVRLEKRGMAFDEKGKITCYESGLIFAKNLDGSCYSWTATSPTEEQQSAKSAMREYFIGANIPAADARKEKDLFSFQQREFGGK